MQFKTMRMGVTVAVVLAGLTLVLSGTAYAQKLFTGGFGQKSGEDVYTSLCQGCHMSDARGAIGAGAYPALANNARLAAAIYPLTVVLHGQRAMPDFGADLSDEQIANVTNYVRTHFGNHYKDVITPAVVAAARRP